MTTKEHLEKSKEELVVPRMIGGRVKRPFPRLAAVMAFLILDGFGNGSGREG
jgi:hypothetical protein